MVEMTFTVKILCYTGEKLISGFSSANKDLSIFFKHSVQLLIKVTRNYPHWSEHCALQVSLLVSSRHPKVCAAKQSFNFFFNFIICATWLHAPFWILNQENGLLTCTFPMSTPDSRYCILKERNANWVKLKDKKLANTTYETSIWNCTPAVCWKLVHLKLLVPKNAIHFMTSLKNSSKYKEKSLIWNIPLFSYIALIGNTVCPTDILDTLQDVGWNCR
jgi:hypothetical protein